MYALAWIPELGVRHEVTRLTPTGIPLVAIGLALCLTSPFLLEAIGADGGDERTPFTQLLVRLFSASALFGVLALGLNWGFGYPAPPSFAGVFAFAQFVALGGFHGATLILRRAVRRSGRNVRNVLVVGSGPRARHLLELLDGHQEWGLHVIALVDESETPFDPKLIGHRIVKVADLGFLLRNEVVDEAIVASTRSMFPTVEAVVSQCAQIGVPVTMLSDIFGDLLPPPRVVQLDRLPALSFAPVHHNATALLIKRSIDFAAALVLLALTSPVLVVASILIRMTSQGPIFFRQLRCGLHGRRFTMYKLRTMAEGAEEQKGELAHLNERSGPVFKIRRDPRITPIGRVLRRWSIDELPQLWNVLKGDMSLVGPRPPVPSEVQEYRPVDQRRLSMRPGLTCWWQVLGRSEIGWNDQVRLDVEYIDSWSLLNDLRILAKTVPAVVSGKGAS